jgi:hypothetical protein
LKDDHELSVDRRALPIVGTRDDPALRLRE